MNTKKKIQLYTAVSVHYHQILIDIFCKVMGLFSVFVNPIDVLRNTSIDTRILSAGAIWVFDRPRYNASQFSVNG